MTDEIFYNYNRRENSLTADSKTALTNLFRTIAVLQDSEFYKNAPITLQAVMLDWMLPEVQVYWVNCYGFEKEISSLMDSFNRFDKSILSQLKIYPLFKKIVFISRCPFLKFFYLKLLNIPQPVLKKLKRIAMR